MGQIVSSADLRSFIESNVAGYVTQVTGPYARLFAKTPTFVTYYSQDLAQGSTDTNLGGSIEIVGPESALRYKSVANFPLYGISDLDVSTAYDEVQGSTSGNVQGEAMVLPGTIEPYENDLFTIDHLNTQLIFRVKVVDADRVEGKAFFRTQYFLDQSSPLDLQTQVTGAYEFEIGNVGTNLTPILVSSLANALQRLSAVEETIRASYWRAFFDRSSSALILRHSGFTRAVHDNALDLFVSRNDLLTSNTYLGSRRVVPVDYDDRGMFLDTVYPTTLYWASENALLWGDVRAAVVNIVDLMPARPLNPASALFESFCVDGVFEAAPIAYDDGTTNYYIGGTTFLDEIDAVGPTGTSGYDAQPMRALAQKCLNGTFRFAAGDDPGPAVAAIVDAMNDTALLASRPDLFWLGPIALMEAKLIRTAAAATTY